MGLFDNFSLDNLDDPKNQALFAAAMSMIAPKQQKTSVMGDIGSSGLLGLQTLGVARKQQRDDRTNELGQIGGLYKVLKDMDNQAQQDSLTGLGPAYRGPSPQLTQLESRMAQLTGVPSIAKPAGPPMQLPMPPQAQAQPPMPPPGMAPPSQSPMANPDYQPPMIRPQAPPQAAPQSMPQPAPQPAPQAQGDVAPGAMQFRQMLDTAGIPPAVASMWMRTPQGTNQLMKHLGETFGPRTVNNVLMQLQPGGQTKILGGMMGQDTLPVTIGSNGQPQIAPIGGATDYFANRAGAVTDATEAAKAKRDVISVPQPDGSTRMMTREQFVGGAKPAAPTPAAPTSVASGSAPGVATVTVTQPSKGFGAVSQTPGDKVQQEDLAKFHAQTFIDTQQAGRSAQSGLQKLDRIDQLMQGVDTGKLTPAGMQVSAYAQALGIPIDPKLPNKQAAEALTGQIALELRNPSGGAGMPGALSDNDLKFLKSMTPGLAQTTEGRKMIIDTKRKTLQRDQEVAQLARDYRKQNAGRLDDGFTQTLADYSSAHPLFAQPQQSSQVGGFKVLGVEQ